jgi:hypothetical protein
MKQKASLEQSRSGNETGNNPFNPNRGIKLLNSLEAGLTETHGRKFTIAEVAAYAGQSISTMSDWMSWSKLRQIECVIRLFEALPKSRRKRILNEVCRALPTISHNRIAWAETQVSILELLIRKDNGVSIIQGEENVRGFVATAFGHSALRTTPFHKDVVGIDVRLPTEFVPVPGIQYVNQLWKPDLLRERVKGFWPLLLEAKGKLIILNGVWSATSQLKEKLKALTPSNHVVLADSLNLSIPELADPVFQPAHILNVSNFNKNLIKIRVHTS